MTDATDDLDEWREQRDVEAYMSKQPTPQAAAISRYWVYRQFLVDTKPDWTAEDLARLYEVVLYTDHAQALVRAKRERWEDVQHILGPFASGGDWGAWKAWLVNGAPTREQGIEAAKLMTRLQCNVDEYCARQAVEQQASDAEGGA